MTTTRNWIMLSLFATNVLACSAENAEFTGKHGYFADSNITMPTSLTITKVKKPWYAWKGLVVGKMKKSLQEYAAVKGLQHKYYSFTEDHHYFGGIYLWKSEQDAKNWFNQTWFERTEKKYGYKGIVLSFQIKKIKTIAHPQKNEVANFAVLSYSQNSSNEFNINLKGLFQVIELIDPNQKVCYLTIWENKEAADSLFSSKESKIEYFEVPLLLNNEK